MVFASPVFLCFFLPLVLLAYFCSSARWKNAVLLIASLIYYAWGEGVYCEFDYWWEGGCEVLVKPNQTAGPSVSALSNRSVFFLFEAQCG